MGTVQSIRSSSTRMTPGQFISKWSRSTLKESSGAQQHFLDLCRLLDEPTPSDVDPHGEWYCFERGARKTDGGNGWADVWKKGFFAWEYKGKHKNLEAAFAQLQRYAIALENPPLLVVSDMETIEVHTNYTNTPANKHIIRLPDLASEQNLSILKFLFSEPDRLKPGKTNEAITEEAAGRFAALAQVLRDRGGDPEQVAHFLTRILFCLFAEDAKLLPDSIVKQLLDSGVKRPDQANRMLRLLFAAMKKGGVFGPHVIDWFNGNLFDSNDAVPLNKEDIRELLAVSHLDWSAIEPSIFGTLFERGLDPKKRDQIGAHYTDRCSIVRIIGPVVREPLEAQWRECKAEIVAILQKADKARGHARLKLRQYAQMHFERFLQALQNFKVLDPACGSGNFLYLALQALKDLEHMASFEAEKLGLRGPISGMHVGVQCLRGIEINTYAAELARVTVWIGEIQWMLRHGLPPSRNPILKPLETIECRDALINDDGTEATWPDANVIIGNPPFLGAIKMRRELGDRYTVTLRKAYSGRVPGGADLVCFWFEKARTALLRNARLRIGLVATNSIRQPANRKVLERILENGTVRTAWSDEPWVNEGASVRVSIICIDGDKSTARGYLDEKPAERIYADLTSARVAGPTYDLTKAKPLAENQGWSYFGFSLAGPFTISREQAMTWIALPNPHGVSNRNVLRPLWIGDDVMGRWDNRWVIDFGGMSESEASLYELPFQHVEKHVKPIRESNRRASRARYWWRYGEVRPGLRSKLKGLSRYIVTSEKSKHRIFAWLASPIAPEHRLIVFPRDDDVFFGLLSSRIHTCWALAVGSTLEDRPAYATTTCFNAFPFPSGLTPNLPPSSYKQPHANRIASAAKKLTQMREAWLNPPEWCDRLAEFDPAFPGRIVARKGHESDLKKRTLTKLYNELPTWLKNLHVDLDTAVASAYGWDDYSPEMPDENILERLMQLNLSRSADLFNTSNDKTNTAKAKVQVTDLDAASSDNSRTLDRRLAVVCTLVNRLADGPHFGRTKLAKLFYLADLTQDLNFETTYFREAAGPLDTEALYSGEVGFEALGIRNGYIKVARTGNRIRYGRGQNLAEGMAKAREILGKQRSDLNRLIDLFRPLDTDQCEIVATLYACWNDRLIDGKDASDEAVVTEFREEWHPKKRRFSRERLLKALEWMRKHGIVPSGEGAHTQTRRR